MILHPPIPPAEGADRPESRHRRREHRRRRSVSLPRHLRMSTPSSDAVCGSQHEDLELRRLVDSSLRQLSRNPSAIRYRPRISFARASGERRVLFCHRSSRRHFVTCSRARSCIDFLSHPCIRSRIHGFSSIRSCFLIPFIFKFSSVCHPSVILLDPRHLFRVFNRRDLRTFTPTRPSVDRVAAVLLRPEFLLLRASSLHSHPSASSHRGHKRLF